IHDIQWPGPKIPTTPDGSGLVLPEANGREFMARKFKEPVDVVLFGDTHEELVMDWDGVLIMNPGSPTYPGKRHKRGVLGTIGLLEVDGEDATGRIVDLEDILTPRSS
ncbi:MAG: metallophosphoesterase family protein, partial [Chloroflexi bacterium]|nr:metallophosphoesterase family protein [Chloroflexota bacterium]